MICVHEMGPFMMGQTVFVLIVKSYSRDIKERLRDWRTGGLGDWVI